MRSISAPDDAAAATIRSEPLRKSVIRVGAQLGDAGQSAKVMYVVNEAG